MFSKFESFGCFNSIIECHDTLLIYLDFMEDVHVHLYSLLEFYVVKV